MTDTLTSGFALNSTTGGIRCFDPANPLLSGETAYPDHDSAHAALLASAVGLAQAQTTQSNALKTACTAAITGGFTSSALGSVNTYPSDITSQSNLAQTAACAAGGSLWCENSANVWAFTAHTQAQAQQVMADFVAWRDKQQAQLASLTAEVTSAATIAAVQTIVWP